MATLTIRNLDNEVKTRLRVRAAQRGRSMEEEARSILKVALTQTAPLATGATLVKAIRERAERLGGVELKLPRREPGREPPDFSAFDLQAADPGR